MCTRVHTARPVTLHACMLQDKEKKAKGKLKGKASSASSSSDSEHSSVSSDGSSSSSSEEEEQAPKRVRLASHVGRYQKRERAKFVKSYSATDLEAILGAQAVRAAKEEDAKFAAMEVCAVARDDDSSDGDADDESSDSDGDEAAR